MKAFKSFFKPIDPTIEYDPEELLLGIKVELEHTPYAPQTPLCRYRQPATACPGRRRSGR